MKNKSSEIGLRCPLAVTCGLQGKVFKCAKMFLALFWCFYLGTIHVSFLGEAL